MKKIIVYESEKIHDSSLWGYRLWNAPYVTESLAGTDIEFEPFDGKKKYSKNEIFYISGKDFKQGRYPIQLLNYKIIVNITGESFINEWKKVYKSRKNILFIYGCDPLGPQKNIVYFPSFFRCDTATGWMHLKDYKSNKTYLKKFLMPVKNQTHHAAWRATAVEKLRDLLDQSIYSVWAEKIYLPGSDSKGTSREINTQWFDDTHYSIILEHDVAANLPYFLTEKTWKAIAFRHPFMLMSSPGSLKRIKEMGFETFGNLFDESYDQSQDLENRLEIVRKNIENYRYVPYDNVTLQKIEHNHNLFFNKEKILELTKKELIEPLLKWIG